MRSWLALAAAIVLACTVRADQDVSGGTHGPLYPIAEKDMLGVIEESIEASKADGTMDARLREAKERAVAYVDAPPPVPGLRRASSPASVLFDPSVFLERPVIDAAGATIHPAGTRVNPLRKASLRGRLVLFDAGDPWQVRLVASLAGDGTPTRAVLVAGSPAAFERQSGMRAYFDQHGSISKRFRIKAVPAVLTQEGMALRIVTHVPEAAKDDS